jgi:hypothetical protein
MEPSELQRSDVAATSTSGTSWYCRTWRHVLELSLVLWVVRVPITTTSLALLILGFAPQAQDLFVEFAREPLWRIPLFLFLLLLVWAMPTHYSRRLLLDTDTRFQRVVAAQAALAQAFFIRLAARCIPRALGLLPFAAILVAIWRSHVNLPIFSDPNDRAAVDAVNQVLRWLALLVILFAAVFLIYTIRRRRDADIVVLRSLKSFNWRLEPFWRKISPGVWDTDTDANASRDVGRLLLVTVFVAFLAIFLFGADTAASLAPRSMAVPFILGGWLPFLAYLSGAGRQFGAPLIVGLFALVALLAVVVGDNHSVRLINASKKAGREIKVAPLPLNKAVSLWMHENQCEVTPAVCPRPILVAAAGGASRASFFMASVIGSFMQDAPAHGLDANQVRNRLFAISAVSGGSVGAVMVAAALDAKGDSADHPCVRAPFVLWWGQTIDNWRDCFEALTTGDFLSADFFAFAFNDMLPFRLRDRAAVLEDSFAERYQTVIKRADPPRSPSCQGLDCPFLSLQPRTGHWIPLLVLNSTSEATGGRIVTTSLAASYDATANCPTLPVPSGCKLFVDADRFHDLLAYPAPVHSQNLIHLRIRSFGDYRIS